MDISNNSTSTNSSAYGGAISIYNSTLNINENLNGVSIKGNTITATKTSSWGSGVAAEGGAIYGQTLNLQNNNGKVEIQGNTATTVNSGTAKGAAIYLQNALNITGNKEVVFRGNVEQDSAGTRLRSVYVDSKSAQGALNLSAAADGNITFYDSLYAAPNSSSYALTADFNKESGNTGTIVFSGKHAAADLGAVKESYTDAELAASRTSTINSLLTLHQGTLSIEEAACLQTQGMTANVGSNLNLQNGSLQMLDGATLTLNGSLSAEGSNTIEAGNLTYGDGSSFSLTLSAANLDKALLSLSSVSSLSYGIAEVNFLGLSDLADGEYKVLDLSAASALAAQQWVTEGITLKGLNQNDHFKWNEGGTVLSLVHISVPEPSTATLGLLALTGLAARRRRK